METLKNILLQSMFFIVVIFLISYFSVDSFNPIKVYTDGNKLAKVVISFSALIVFFSIIANMYIQKIDEKAVCEICKKPIRESNSVMGGWFQCKVCKCCYHKKHHYQILGEIGVEYSGLFKKEYVCKECKDKEKHKT